MKQCAKCSRAKPITEFILRNKKRPEIGRSTRCKECALEYTRKYNERNRVELNAIAAEKRKKNPEKFSAATAKWRANNPGASLESKRRCNEKNWGKFLADGRAAYAKDPEKFCARKRKWRELNPDRARAIYSKWVRANPEKVKALKLNRRSIEGMVTPQEIRARVAYLGGKCVYCGGPYEHLDHFEPIARGGSGKATNVVPSCACCNLAKSSKPPGKWTIEKMGQGVLFI